MTIWLENPLIQTKITLVLIIIFWALFFLSNTQREKVATWFFFLLASLVFFWRLFSLAKTSQPLLNFINQKFTFPFETKLIVISFTLLLTINILLLLIKKPNLAAVFLILSAAFPFYIKINHLELSLPVILFLLIFLSVWASFFWWKRTGVFIGMEIKFSLLLLLVYVGFSLFYSPHYLRGVILYYLFFLAFSFLYLLIANLFFDQKVINLSINALLTSSFFFSLIGFFFFNPNQIISNSFKKLAQFFPLWFESSFWEPHLFGRFLIPLITLALAISWKEKEVLKKIAFGGIALLPLLVIFFISSWVTLISLSFSLIFFFLIYSEKIFPWRKKIIFFLTFFLLFILALFFIDLHSNWLLKTFGSKWLLLLTGGKYFLIKSNLSELEKHFLLGRGLGSYFTLKPCPTSGLDIFLEFGLIGIGFFAFFLYRAFLMGLNSFSELREEKTKLFQAGLFASLIGIFLHSIFYDVFFGAPDFWLILGMLAGLREVSLKS